MEKLKEIIVMGETILNKEAMPVFAQLQKPFRMNLFLNTVTLALESKGSRSKRKRNAA